MGEGKGVGITGENDVGIEVGNAVVTGMGEGKGVGSTGEGEACTGTGNGVGIAVELASGSGKMLPPSQLSQHPVS